MSKKCYICILMIVGFLLASAGTYVIAEEEPLSPEEITRVWKERGSEALSRLDLLGGKDDIRSKYQYLLESAFAAHATIDKSRTSNFVHVTENGYDLYKIILNKGGNPKSTSGEDEVGFFIINYIYDHKTGEFMGINIEQLPQGWFIHATPKLPDTIALNVNDNNILIIFDMKYPENSTVDSF